MRLDGLLNLTDALRQATPQRAIEDFASFSRAVRDEASFVQALMRARAGKDGLVVSIGDFPLPGLEGFSVVSCSFGPHSGILGVIGPLWMDYGRSLSAASYVANRLESLLATPRSATIGRIRR